MSRPIATTALAVALLACEGAPTGMTPPLPPTELRVERGTAGEGFGQFQQDSGYRLLRGT